MLKTRWMMERRREQGRWIERREKWLGRKERRERWRGEDEWRWCCRNQPRSGGKICTNPVCRQIFLEREQSFISFFFFFPSLHILEVSSICWSIGFYDSRLNFSKVTSTWGILVFFFMTIPSQKGKTSFTHFQSCSSGREAVWMPEDGIQKKKKETNKSPRKTQRLKNLLFYVVVYLSAWAATC